MNERAKLLLEMILAHSTLTQQEAAIYFGVSERTIRNTVDEIDDVLATHQLSSIERQTRTYLSFKGDSTTAWNVLNNQNEYAESDWLNPTYREQLIYLTILTSGTRITVEELEKISQSSRSTIHTDLKRLKALMAADGVRLQSDIKRGFYLEGNENAIRSRYVNALSYMRRHNPIPPILQQSELEFINYCLHRIENELGTELTYDSFLRVLDYCVIMIYRIKSGYEMSGEVEAGSRQSIDLKTLSVLETFFDIELTAAEVSALNDQFDRAHLMHDERIRNGLNVQLGLLAGKFVERVGQALHVNFANGGSFIDNLTMHLQTVINQKNTPTAGAIASGMIAQIKHDYPRVYQEVSKAVDELPDLKKLGFASPENLGLLTVHVVSGMEAVRQSTEDKLKVLLVCHLGIGTSQLLRLRLQSQFGFHPEIASSSDVTDAIRLNTQYDLIIATVKINNPTLKYVQVSPYIRDAELTALKRNVESVVNRKLENEFQSFEEEVWSPMLKELLTPETIRVNVPVADWQDAITKAGQLMVVSGAIEPPYVQSMIKVVQDFGSYIVILPGIALAHASSASGVNRIGMSLITLANDVPFGNKANDPVHTVICLATVDHDTHLRALSELVTLLNDETFKQKLAANDSTGIIEAIKAVEIEGEQAK